MRWSLSLESARARRLFFSALGIVFLCAFTSLSVQIEGLIGERGILPVYALLDGARAWLARHPGAGTLWRDLPTLCWLDSSDAFLAAQCRIGIALALLLILGVAPLFVLPLSWLLYLSLVIAGQDFLSFQWDTLLLETSFFAIWFAPAGLLPWGPPRWLWFKRRRADDPEPPPPTSVSKWALRLLLFRLMVGSGFIKLSSGDPVWRDGTVLTYHYLTQPLPTAFAWWAEGLPPWFQRFSCYAMFAIELGTPFLLFCGRFGRNLFGLATIALMVAIAVTGNYGFFNLLTVVLALLVLDRPGTSAAGLSRGRRIGRAATAAIAAAFALLGLQQFGVYVSEQIPFEDDELPLARAVHSVQDDVGSLTRIEALRPIWRVVTPFETLNNYHLFAGMTRERIELVVEGSDDRTHWLPYEFRWKPGDLRVAPCWCSPHMPRLDWQMWFASQDDRVPAWFDAFLHKLLEGAPCVVDLLATNPFAKKPPRFVRAMAYEYRFTTRESKAETHEWWRRIERGVYRGPIERR